MDKAEPYPTQSSRNAMTGSTREALRAGNSEAAIRRATGRSAAAVKATPYNMSTSGPEEVRQRLLPRAQRRQLRIQQDRPRRALRLARKAGRRHRQHRRALPGDAKDLPREIVPTVAAAVGHMVDARGRPCLQQAPRARRPVPR